MKYRQLQASHNVIYLLLTVIILCIVPSFALGELKVVFLDVGQGDSTVILCDGIAMLVDGVRRDNSQYINECGEILLFRRQLIVDIANQGDVQ